MGSKTYTFDELSEAAKDVAREWYRQGALDYEWWEAAIETAKEIGATIGIDIDKVYFSGFSSQGDGACFEGTYHYKKGGLKELLKNWPPVPTQSKAILGMHKVARQLQDLQSKNFYRLEASVRHSGFYQHSGCTSISVSYDNDPYKWTGAQYRRDVPDDVEEI